MLSATNLPLSMSCDYCWLSLADSDEAKTCEWCVGTQRHPLPLTEISGRCWIRPEDEQAGREL